MQYILAVFSLLFSNIVLGGPFDPSPQDKSIEILGIFGNIGTVVSGKANPVLQQVFDKFNWAMVSASVIILGYISIVSIINTAQEGQAMGKKWSSVWIPLRSMLGMLLMVPIAGSGYSVIQGFVMWIAVQGVGLADNLWAKILDSLKLGISATSDVKLNATDRTTLATNGKKLFADLLNVAICEQGLLAIYRGKSNNPAINNRNPQENSDLALNQAEKIKLYNDAAFLSPGSANGNVYLGIKGDPSYKQVCGSFKVDNNVTAGDIPGAGQSALDTAAQGLYSAKIYAINSVYELARRVARGLTTTPGDKLAKDLWGIQKQAADRYVSIMTGQVKPPQNTSAAIDSLVTEGKNAGWAVAGSYYFALNKTPILNLLESAKSIPAIALSYTDSNSGAFAFLKDPAEKNYLNYLSGEATKFIAAEKGGDATFTSTALQSANAAENTLVRHLVEVITKASGGIYGLFVSVLNDSSSKGGSSDPLVMMAILGQGIMYISETTWMIVTGITIVASLTGACAALSPGFATLFTVIFALGTVTLGLLMTFYSVGVSLGLYLPMVPYMIFTTAVIGWAMLVIEAVVAGPVIALGIIAPSQDELGKVAAALPILANIFLRPSLMIIGFILSAKLLQAIVAFVNFGFYNTVLLVLNPAASDAASTKAGTTREGDEKLVGSFFVQDGSSSFQDVGQGISNLAQGSIFLPLFIIILYTVLIIAITNNVFSLIYLLADRFFRYAGGGVEHAGQESAKMTGETKQGFDKGKGQVEGGMQTMGTMGMKEISGQLSEAKGKAKSKANDDKKGK